MGQQYNKMEKRKRRLSYIRRRKDAVKAKAKAKTVTPAPAAEPAQT
jgi:hypothetical protein